MMAIQSFTTYNIPLLLKSKNLKSEINMDVCEGSIETVKYDRRSNGSLPS